MRALQFATATANLACQNAFLFLAAHSPMCISASSSATLIWTVWVPVLSLKLLAHPPTCRENDRYKVHTTLVA